MAEDFSIIDGNRASPIVIEASARSELPLWSWDRVRSWVAVRRADCYSDEQINQIAHHDVVMLEKFNGHVSFGTTEEGTFQAAKRIKIVNPLVKILFYLNSMIHYPGYAANSSFDAEKWATRGRDGELFKFKNRYYFYDHRNLDFREWWIQRALDMLSHDEIDGVFIDAICKTVHPKFCADGHGEAYIATAHQLRSRLPPGKLLLGNALRASIKSDGPGGIGNVKHLTYLDGSYLEGWSTTPSDIVKSIELMCLALKQGRIILLPALPFCSMPPGHEKQRQVKEFNLMSLEHRYNHMEKYIGYPLSIFLLIVEPFAYFSYHFGVDVDPRRGNAAFDCDHFEELKRKLGKAKGPHQKEGKFVFRREFEYMEVWVNVETRNFKLVVKDNQHISGGHSNNGSSDEL